VRRVEVLQKVDSRRQDHEITERHAGQEQARDRDKEWSHTRFGAWLKRWHEEVICLQQQAKANTASLMGPSARPALGFARAAAAFRIARSSRLTWERGNDH
jgi:hypothetical protein